MELKMYNGVRDGNFRNYDEFDKGVYFRDKNNVHN
jgi:hypothetical protein